MPKPGQAFSLVAALSAVAFAVVAVGAVVGSHRDAISRGVDDELERGFSISPRFHVRFSDGGMWFSSEVVPYRGSILGLGDGEGNVSFGDGRIVHRQQQRYWVIGDVYGFGVETYADQDDRTSRKHTACTLPGIYFRRFHWVGEQSDWTLMLSNWYTLALFAVLPALWMRRWRQSRHNKMLEDVTADCVESSA